MSALAVPTVGLGDGGGQSAVPTQIDRQDCNRWATMQPAAMADAQAVQRAVAACLDRRGHIRAQRASDGQAFPDARHTMQRSPQMNPRTRLPIRHGLALPWLLAALLLTAGAGLWWWRVHAADAAAGPPAQAASAAGGRRFGGGVQPVSVQAVRRQDIRVSVSAIGSISASNTAIVRAQVGGVLQRLNFKEGQPVKAGQVLAEIDPRPFQAALAQAEGALARDKAQLDGAKVDLARYRELMAKDAIPRQQMETQAALVGQLEGTVEADQGTVDNARLQLSYARVVAPISGRAGLKQVDLGNVVQPADPNGIVSITQTRPIAMVFAVPAANVPRLVARLKAQQPLPVEAWDRGGKQPLAVGRVASLDNAIDASTDTIKVKALFPNADDALFPNQAVSVTLQLDTLSDVLAVPQAAVLRGAQGFYVYVVNADNTVGTRVVKPGAVDGNWMAVEADLQAGEKVVIDGSDRLREGAKVEVIAADPRQRAGAAAGGGRRGGGGGRDAASGAGTASGGNAERGRPDGGGAAASGAGGAAAGEGRARRGEAAAAGTAPTAAAPGAPPPAGEEGRPRWMDRLTPEQAEKVKGMSPDERRAWFRAQREAGKLGPAP